MFGSHLSIAGSMTNALLEAESLGLDCVQVFTKNQQQWKAKPLEQSAIDEWTSHLTRLGWRSDGPGDGKVVSHASYLSNLASVNPELYEASIDLMRTELERCEQLGIRLLVFHPGAHTTATLEEGIGRIAAACARLVKETGGYRAALCLENVAGQGSTVGRTFQELAEIRRRAVEDCGAADRIGYCIDTAHAHAAGYDLSTRAGAQRVLEEMTATLGAANIRCAHVNDSKTPCASRVDRHAHIGEGTIGLAGFAAVVNHPRFARIPKVMETPKEEKKPAAPPAWDQVNVARLRELVGSSADTFPAVTPIGAATKVVTAASVKNRTPVKGKRTEAAQAKGKAAGRASGRVPKPAATAKRGRAKG